MSNLRLFRLITVKARGREIIIIARDENCKKVKIRVTDFYPYFYSKRVPISEDVVKVERGHKTLFGETVYKIYVRHPGVVPKLRSPEDYEADIPYVRRWMIDANIKDYFYIPEDKLKMNPETGEYIVSTEDIIPKEVEE